MNKLKFAVQIVVLVLAFPVWFYAEMKQADKAMKNRPSYQTDSIPVTRKAMSIANPELSESRVYNVLSLHDVAICN